MTKTSLVFVPIFFLNPNIEIKIKIWVGLRKITLLGFLETNKNV